MQISLQFLIFFINLEAVASFINCSTEACKITPGVTPTTQLSYLEVGTSHLHLANTHAIEEKSNLLFEGQIRDRDQSMSQSSNRGGDFDTMGGLQNAFESLVAREETVRNA